ncbi:MAG: adenosine deaminase [Bacteroidetes bacterium]|nr:adenosine deaminase [Bacteroidota bacterium]
MKHPPLPGWFGRIPKAELHLHLEGAIPHDFLIQLAERNGADVNSLLAGFTYENFTAFIRQWMRVIGQFRQPQDFSELVVRVADQQAAQGIRYTEAFFSPFDYTDGRFSAETVTEAILDGARTVNREGKTTIRLLADIVRNHGGESAVTRVDRLLPLMGEDLIGIGLGGSEAGFPEEGFAAAFQRARSAGCRVVAHAGETAGADRVEKAIRLLGAERIGHGIHSIQDPGVLSLLSARNIPLEICITSNHQTGAWPAGEPHPVHRLLAAGVPLTLNTDDPAFFGTTLADEARLFLQTGGSESDLKILMLNGWRYSFLPETEKQTWLGLVKEGMS